MGMISNLKKVSSAELNKLLEDPSELTKVLYENEDESSHYDLDKAWHAIHYMLNGSVWEVSSIAGELFLGGELVSEQDVGYGPARYFDANKVSEIYSELDKISIEDLFSKYTAMLEQSEIYPGFEDSAEDRDYINYYFSGVKEFCKKAVQENMCLITYLA